VLSWANELPPKVETDKTSLKVVEPNSFVIVPGYNNLFAGLHPAEAALCRSALMRITEPAVALVAGRAISPASARHKNVFVILVGPNPGTACPDVFTPDVLNYVDVVRVPRPSPAEIRDTARNQIRGIRDPQSQLPDKALASPRTNGPLAEDQAALDQTSNALAGLTLFSAVNAINLTVVKSRDLDPLVLREQYRHLIEQHPALTLPDYTESFDDVVGNELYREYIEDAFHPENANRPKGIMLIGVPGSGKTLTVKATANLLKKPVVFVNMGTMFGSLLGQTEANLAKAFATIDAMGDPIVFFDEGEKAFGGMNGPAGDGGVAQRSLGTTLSWLNDRKGRALIMMTCNDLLKLPAEFRRSGRFDATFFFDVPTRAQRVQLFELNARRHDLQKIDPKGWAAKTKFWTGADIEALVKTAAMFRRRCKTHGEALERAMRYIKPLCKSDPDFHTKRAQNLLTGIPGSVQDADQEIDEANRQRAHRSLSGLENGLGPDPLDGTRGVHLDN
jgi:AAA+ superfamily predicted ATPase